jgi:hypothetical protein
MAHLLAALLDLDRHHGTADRHTAEVTFTPAGHRTQGWAKPGPSCRRAQAAAPVGALADREADVRTPVVRSASRAIRLQYQASSLTQPTVRLQHQ